jgi:hypothetical protein
MNIIKARKRVMAIGCTHGNRANKNALAAALLFREVYRPDEVIHLGDAYDLASLRAGSLANPSDSDAADDYLDDIECGASFLNDLRPTVFTLGNHDQRAQKYLRHHNTVVRGFAEAVWERMIKPIEKHCHTFIKHNDVSITWVDSNGDTAFCLARISCGIVQRLGETASWHTRIVLELHPDETPYIRLHTAQAP